MTAQTQRVEILDDPPQRLGPEEDIKRLLEEQSFCAAGTAEELPAMRTTQTWR